MASISKTSQEGPVGSPTSRLTTSTPTSRATRTTTPRPPHFKRRKGDISMTTAGLFTKTLGLVILGLVAISLLALLHPMRPANAQGVILLNPDLKIVNHLFFYTDIGQPNG